MELGNCCTHVLVVVFLALIATVLAKDGDIHLTQGPVSGILKRSVNGKSFYAYLGIPYATPPLGHLRFQEPWRHPGWEEETVRVGRRQPPPCLQWSIPHNKVIGSENCLYLNVFATKLPSPSNPNQSYKPPLPVMVYIHGGQFHSGAASSYGPEILMDVPKVLVVIQYRLGALGFLSTMDSEAPGNYGLLDVVMALKWVNENAYKFNGDKNRTTVFGNSAGGAIVSMLIASPLAAGLFSSAIAQSGSAFCPWAIGETHEEDTNALANRLQCFSNDSKEMIQCLRDVSAEKILIEQQHLSEKSLLHRGFQPIIDYGMRDNPFLPAHPQELYSSNSVNKVNLMAGVTTDEGLVLLQLLLQKDHTFLRNGTILEHDLLPNVLDDILDDTYDAETLWEGIKHVYFRDTDFDNQEEVVPVIVEMFGDAMFHSCVDELLRLHSVQKPDATYAYVFGMRSYATQSHPLNKHLAELATRSFFQRAVNHADEVPHLFVINKTSEVFSWLPEVDVNGHDNVAKLWNNFATHGKPTLESSYAWPPVINSLPMWPTYSPENQNFYHIHRTPSLWPGNFRHRELSTWRHLLSNAEQAAADKQKPDPLRVYKTVLWALVAAVGFLAFVVLVLAMLLVCTGKKGSFKPNS